MVAGTLINRALDRGINFIDTARGYGLSEERIGRHLSWRRNDFILSTKVGYGVDGVEDWTYSAIVRGTEEALRKMKTGYIDVILLHSCPAATLQKEEVLRALEDIKARGTVRFTGYSGENEDLDAALKLSQIQVVETSVNICDQGNIADSFAPQGRFSHLGGRGVIAKRPLANAFWRFSEQPKGNYGEEYWLRWQEMMGNETKKIDQTTLDEKALRFSIGVPMVSTAIVGTGKVENLELNAVIAAKGPLSPKEYKYFRDLWLPHSGSWRGQV